MSKSFFGSEIYRRKFLSLVGVSVMALTLTTQASLNLADPVSLFSGSKSIWETDMAFDPETNLALTVYRYDDRIYGVYAQPDGDPAGSAFVLVGNSSGAPLFPRIAARAKDGTGGGFLVTYYVNGTKQAVFARPGQSTLGPVQLASGVAYERSGGGVVYVPEYDAAIVTYPKGDHTFARAFRVDGSSLEGVGSEVQVTSGGSCSLARPEIAWDGDEIALVAGWADYSDCTGGVWTRRVRFDGQTLTALGSMGWAAHDGPSYEDVEVAYSDLIDKFVLVWVKFNGSTRPILKRTLDPDDGSLGDLRVILPAKPGGSTEDDKFGRNDQVGLAYNPHNGRFLLAARGNDTSSTDGQAPAYALELDTNGDAIPYTLRPYVSWLVKDPWPQIAAIPGTNNFLITSKAGPTGNSLKEIKAVVVTGNGSEGNFSWPTSPYEGGGSSEPPPPSGGSTVLLTILNPNAGGTITGGGLNCGPGTVGTCSVLVTQNASLTLTANAASGYEFADWSGSGCPSGAAAVNNITMSVAKVCTADFDATSGPPPPPPPSSGYFTLTITPPPVGGKVTTVTIDCGLGATKCATEFKAGFKVSLKATAGSGYQFSAWTGDCAGGKTTMTQNRTCGAIFVPNGSGGGSPPPPPSGGGSYTLTIDNPGDSSVFSGRVNGNGILCSPGNIGWCTKTLAAGTVFTLKASPGAGFFFEGWEGAGCPTGNATTATVTMNSSKTCKANFSRN